MVAHSRAGPAVGFNEPEALSKELENAFNEFERSHRNRLVARNDFAHRKDHQQAVRRSQPRMLWGERKAWYEVLRYLSTLANITFAGMMQIEKNSSRVCA